MREKVGAALCFYEQGSSSIEEPQILYFQVAVSPRTEYAIEEGRAPGSSAGNSGQMCLLLSEALSSHEQPLGGAGQCRDTCVTGGRCSCPQDRWVGWVLERGHTV